MENSNLKTSKKELVGKFIGLVVLVIIIIAGLVGSVKIRIDSYNNFITTKAKVVPGPFTINLKNFKGIVVEESKLSITGVVIEKGEDPKHFKEGAKNSTSESILSYSHYGYTESQRGNRNKSSSKAREYVLNLKLYNVTGSCNRYERFDYKTTFFYRMGDHVYGLADEVVASDDAIVIKVRQKVRGFSFWAKTTFYSLLKAEVIFLFILWFRNARRNFKQYAKVHKAQKNLSN